MAQVATVCHKAFIFNALVRKYDVAGKSFVLNVIIETLMSEARPVITCAASGVAALELKNGHL